MRHPQWEMLHPRMNIDRMGYVPSFFDLDDPRPAKEQLNERYAHGGGFSSIRSFTMNGETLLYPEDPPFLPLAKAQLNGEKLLFYQHAILAIVQSDGSFEVTRVD